MTASSTKRITSASSEVATSKIVFPNKKPSQEGFGFTANCFVWLFGLLEETSGDKGYRRGEHPLDPPGLDGLPIYQRVCAVDKSDADGRNHSSHSEAEGDE